MAKRLNLDWQVPKVLVAPIKGASAKQLYEQVPEHLRVGIRYDEKSQEVIGSTVFAVAGFDDVLEKFGARTTSLRDLSLPEVMAFAKGKYWIDGRTLVARTQTDSDYSKNNSLLKILYGLAEEQLGSIKHPFMVGGFTFAPTEDETGYGLALVKKPDFKITQDERLKGHNGDKFSDVDELGLPLFDKNGNRTWYSRGKGLSRVCLSGYSDLGSDVRDLADSCDCGRVVVVSSEGASQNLVQERLVKLQKLRDAEITKINVRYEKAKAVFAGKD